MTDHFPFWECTPVLSHDQCVTMGLLVAGLMAEFAGNDVAQEGEFPHLDGTDLHFMLKTHRYDAKRQDRG